VTKGTLPPYRLIVWPWLKAPMQRFVLPNWIAITIGRWIFAWRKLDEAELAHELTHVRQWSRYGLTYVPRYYMASRTAAKSGGDRYFDNAFEREAAQAAEVVRKRENR